jgi:hypothetical protein
MVDQGAEYCFAGMFSLDILCSNNFLKSHFGESESAVESCVESCGSFTLVSILYLTNIKHFPC